MRSGNVRDQRREIVVVTKLDLVDNDSIIFR
jgi:hypothetical protein